MIRDIETGRRPRKADDDEGFTGPKGEPSSFVSRRNLLRSGAAGAAIIGGTTLAGCLSDDESANGDDGAADDATGDGDDASDDTAGENGDDGDDGDDTNGGDTGDDDNGDDDDWIQLFNGEDLDGWTPKFEGHEVGENHSDTFVVEDGLLRVRYDSYDDFAIGHLFHEEEFSHYILRAEYRFVDEVPDGQPGFGYRNSGLMLHGERPEEMGVNKAFPRSLELQLLGEAEDADGERPCGDLCTPDTRAENMFGDLVTDHCWADGEYGTDGSTYYGDRWVNAVAVVRGSEYTRHILEDDGIVLEYQSPQLMDGTPIEAGTIALQAEGHPVDFRTVELLELDPDRSLEAMSIPEEVEPFLSDDAS